MNKILEIGYNSQCHTHLLNSSIWKSDKQNNQLSNVFTIQHLLLGNIQFPRRQVFQRLQLSAAHRLGHNLLESIRPHRIAMFHQLFDWRIPHLSHLRLILLIQTFRKFKPPPTLLNLFLPLLRNTLRQTQNTNFPLLLLL